MINERTRIKPSSKEINETIEALEQTLMKADFSAKVGDVRDAFWRGQNISLGDYTRQEVARAATAMGYASDELGLNAYGVRDKTVREYFESRQEESDEVDAEPQRSDINLAWHEAILENCDRTMGQTEDILNIDTNPSQEIIRALGIHLYDPLMAEADKILLKYNSTRDGERESVEAII